MPWRCSGPLTRLGSPTWSLLDHARLVLALLVLGLGARSRCRTRDEPAVSCKQGSVSFCEREETSRGCESVTIPGRHAVRLRQAPYRLTAGIGGWRLKPGVGACVGCALSCALSLLLEHGVFIGHEPLSSRFVRSRKYRLQRSVLYELHDKLVALNTDRT